MCMCLQSYGLSLGHASEIVGRMIVCRVLPSLPCLVAMKLTELCPLTSTIFHERGANRVYDVFADQYHPGSRRCSQIVIRTSLAQAFTTPCLSQTHIAIDINTINSLHTVHDSP